MLGDMEAGEMIAHICDKCGDIYTGEWRLTIVKKDGYKADLCPKCQSVLSEWLQNFGNAVLVPEAEKRREPK